MTERPYLTAAHLAALSRKEIVALRHEDIGFRRDVYTPRSGSVRTLYPNTDTERQCRISIRQMAYLRKCAGAVEEAFEVAAVPPSSPAPKTLTASDLESLCRNEVLALRHTDLGFVRSDTGSISGLLQTVYRNTDPELDCGISARQMVYLRKCIGAVDQQSNAPTAPAFDSAHFARRSSAPPSPPLAAEPITSGARLCPAEDRTGTPSETIPPAPKRTRQRCADYGLRLLEEQSAYFAAQHRAPPVRRALSALRHVVQGYRVR